MKRNLIVASGTFGRYAPDAIEMLSELLEIKYVKLDKSMDDYQIANALDNADVVLLGASGRITRDVMEHLPRLKLIAKHGIGLDNIDVEEATKRGIPVLYCRHTLEEISVAEHTIGLLLAAARRIIEGNEYVKDGRWRERHKLIGQELWNKTLGIIGLGAIGRRVAQIAKKGFEMKVIAYDPYIPDDVFEELEVKRVNFDELLQKSDVITIHVPLTEETRNLLNKERIGKIKDGAIIVNTSRGAVINEEALAESIKGGKVIVALDVMRFEPPEPDNPLLKEDRVVITPHIAAYTYDALRRMDLALAEDITRFLRGEKPIRVANPEVFSLIEDKKDKDI